MLLLLGLITPPSFLSSPVLGAFLKAIARLGTLIAVLVSVWWLMALVLAIAEGYSWREMDWNNDGTTTMSEVWDSADVVRVELRQQDGRPCLGYLRAKDGSTFRTTCDTLGPTL